MIAFSEIRNPIPVLSLLNWKRLLAATAFLWIYPAAHAEPENPAPEGKVTVTETEIKLPGVTVNRETLEARIAATVCLDQGLLEFVVCKPGTFEHESIFTTEAVPELLHAALLLAGLKPTPQVPGMEALWWDKALKQADSRLKIEVEWEEEGKMKRVNLTSMLRNRGEMEGGAEKAADGEVQDAWVFAGSFLLTDKESGERSYAANSGGILVGIWPDPSSVIQYGIANGNPYEGKAFGMEINPETVPAVGTKVDLVFSRVIPPVENPLRNMDRDKPTGDQ